MIDNQPVTFIGNAQAFNFGNVDKHTLLLGPAERADVIIDFSQYAGKTIILYNDAPAAFPAADPRVDYYTYDLDQRDTGGAPTTQPGYGPNTRTIMQIKVSDTTPANAYDLATLNQVFANETGKRGVFELTQPPIIVPQAAYNSAYNKTFTSDVTKQYIQLYQSSHTFQNMSGSDLTIPLEPKAIHDEMNAAYDTEYGRMSGLLGLEMQTTNPLNQNFMLYGFASPPVEVIKDSMSPLSEPSSSDGTQIWRITHNGVDTHTYHFHLYNVQVINRVARDGILLPPDANELGWKETVRTNPLEHTIVALRPVAPQVPFTVPNSTRMIDPTMPAGEILTGPPGGFLDPAGNPVTVLNHLVNFGWEYMIHCHLLGHEEMDMMHTQVFAVAPEAASALTRQPNTLEMSWNDNSISETGFAIQRARDAGFTQNLMNFKVGPGVTKFTDTTTALSTTYYYRMQAINLAGDAAVYAAPAIGFPKTFANSTFSNTITVTTPDIAAPTNLQASLNANPTRITLTWVDASNNEARFAIWRSENGGTPIQIGTVIRSAAQSRATGGTVTFNNRNTATAPLTPGNTYTYYVTAVNAGGSSFNSNTATVNFTAPTAPSDVAGSAVRIPRSTIQDRVTLTWKDNSNNENGFEIQRAPTSAFARPAVFKVGAGVTSFSQNVRRTSDYYYRVLATNPAGSSAWSNVVLVVTP